MYSDFYEIPLPALLFEKVEETDTKVNDTEENDAFQIDHTRKVRDDKRRSAKEKADSPRESRLTSQETTRKGTQTLPNNADTHRQTTLTRAETEDLKIREIKLTYSNNGYPYWNRRH